MQVSEIMRRNVQSVRPRDTIQEAAAKMVETNSEAVPVCSRGRLVGMVVEHDIVARVAALGRDPATTRVGDVMSRDPIYCLEDESEQHLAEEMAHLHVSQLPVLDRSGRVVGMAVLDDVLRATQER
ncbi:MAG TPA: CBS domain-containing protein [Alphaproteobacteria bacterium]|nr:CBS domain-containing protein [Alphaproteobacteria bacterium]